MSWTFNLLNTSPSKQPEPLDSATEDFFLHESFIETADMRAGNNNIPGLFLALVQTGPEPSDFSYYDGVSFFARQLLHDPLETRNDPLTDKPIERVHFCMSSSLGVSNEDLSFHELNIPYDGVREKLLPVVMALTPYHPNLDDATRTLSASLVIELLCHDNLLGSAPKESVLEAVKSWSRYVKKLCKEQGTSKVWTEARQKKVNEVLKTASLFLTSQYQTKKPLKKARVKETCNGIMEILQNVEAGEQGWTCTALSVELDIGKGPIQSALQSLESKKQVRRQKIGKATYYFACETRTVKEAITGLPTEFNYEVTIKEDPEWQKGVAFGKVRQGHPEGAIIFHIEEIFRNIDQWYSFDDLLRSQLRVLAMVHDSFKHQVQSDMPKRGNNHHGYFARTFAEEVVGLEDKEILEIIRRHDDAYYIWRSAKSKRISWDEATQKVKELLACFPNKHHIYRAFFECDCKTGDKTSDPFDWFDEVYQGWLKEGITTPPL